MALSRICSIPDCGKPHCALDFCQRHYGRWRRHGDPLAGRTFEGQPDRFLREVVLSYQGDDCLTWPFWRNEIGSARICLAWRGGSKVFVSRYVCEQLYGPPPSPKHEAAHLCGKAHEGCVNPKHLTWKTHKANINDMVAHGTKPEGERCGTAKLSADDVRTIRSLLGTFTLRKLAAMFGVDESNISVIKRRKSWKFLE